jgi:hypothetical protein
VGYRGKTVLVEVKRDSKAKFTPAQLAWNEAWRGGLVARIESIDDAIALLNAD